MLELTIGGEELYDEATSKFTYAPTFDLELEHSLLSLSKWESKWETPFLSTNDKTTEQVLDYVFFMIKTPGVKFEITSSFTPANLEAVNDYINSAQTATTFGTGQQGRGRREIISAELVYYWMTAFNIPFECEEWHLNRLFALIRICNIKNSKEKKMSSHEINNRNRELNAQRREQLNTSG